MASRGPARIDADVLAQLLLRRSGGPLTIDAAARCLGTSTRTLQRRLAREGSTFRALVDEARFEAAVELLRTTGLPISEISARLGYATPSGFSRAFLRWAGLSPGALRRSATAQRKADR